MSTLERAVCTKPLRRRGPLGVSACEHPNEVFNRYLIPTVVYLDIVAINVHP